MKSTDFPTQHKRADFWVKFAVICVIIFFFLACIKMNIDVNDMKKEVAQAQEEIERKQLEIEKTKQEIDSFELNEETIKKIAKEKLNLRENDAIIFESSQPN